MSSEQRVAAVEKETGRIESFSDGVFAVWLLVAFCRYLWYTHPIPFPWKKYTSNRNIASNPYDWRTYRGDAFYRVGSMTTI